MAAVIGEAPEESQERERRRLIEAARESLAVPLAVPVEVDYRGLRAREP